MPEERPTEQVRFFGIDSFNRPVFRSLEHPNNYFGSTTHLFCQDATEKQVLMTVSEAELEFFGNKFGCEPMGGQTRLLGDKPLEIVHPKTKYSTLIKAKAMIRLKPIEADSQEDAVRKTVSIYEQHAYELFNRSKLHCELEHMEHADGEIEFEVLVDEVEDEDFEKSEFYRMFLDDVLVDTHELRDEICEVIKKHIKLQKESKC